MSWFGVNEIKGRAPSFADTLTFKCNYVSESCRLTLCTIVRHLNSSTLGEFFKASVIEAKEGTFKLHEEAWNHGCRCLQPVHWDKPWMGNIITLPLEPRPGKSVNGAAAGITAGGTSLVLSVV